MNEEQHVVGGNGQVFTWNVKGDFTADATSGVDVGAGAVSAARANVHFAGISPKSFGIASTLQSTTRYGWIVDSGATVTMTTNLLMNNGSVAGIPTTSAFTNNGTLKLGINAITSSSATNGIFVMGPGATVELGNASGFAGGGNISITNKTSGSGFTSLYFDSTANYIFNGSVAQITGSNFPATVNNLSISNSVGVTLSQAVTANGTLTAGTSALLDLNGTASTADKLAGSGTISNNTSSVTLTAGGSGGHQQLRRVSSGMAAAQWP